MNFSESLIGEKIPFTETISRYLNMFIGSELQQRASTSRLAAHISFLFAARLERRSIPPNSSKQRHERKKWKRGVKGDKRRRRRSSDGGSGLSCSVEPRAIFVFYARETKKKEKKKRQKSCDGVFCLSGPRRQVNQNVPTLVQLHIRITTAIG